MSRVKFQIIESTFQRFCQLARLLPQQFPGLWNISAKLVNAIKNIARWSVRLRAPDNSEHRFARPAGETGHTGRRLSFKSLSVELAFARDHYIGVFDFFLQSHCDGNDIEARSQIRAAKTHQAKTETAGRARAEIVSKIAAKITRNRVCQFRERAL